LFLAQLNDRLAGVLPVQLFSFNAAINAQAVVLSWSTGSELNNDYFTVEYSKDGINFTGIGKINSTGNSNSISNYTFEHKTPIAGANYYRLKQVAVDGSFSYSDIKKINYKRTNQLIKNNVVKDILLIEVKTPEAINIFNEAGSKMLSIRVQQQENINVSHYKTGMYFIKSNLRDAEVFFKQ
jgi:hypothetical protein